MSNHLKNDHDSDMEAKKKNLTTKALREGVVHSRVCPISARIAADKADHALHRQTKNCPKVFGSCHPFERVHRIPHEDLCFGLLLGKGGYCNVFAVTIQRETVESRQGQDYSTDVDESSDETKKYALKQLVDQVYESSSTLSCALCDLATEAAFLAHLAHPNIIRLHGIAGTEDSNGSGIRECMEQQVSNTGGGFYLVMDRLTGTLHDRIATWKQVEPLPKNDSAYYMWFHHAEKLEWLRSLHTKRLTVALSIARAVEYLHSLGIMYRDIKPDNVGFDPNDQVKLFDFGLASCEEVRSETAGSRRYMAPEVVEGHRYTKAVDIYSFGILLWEICSLDQPFLNYSCEDHYIRVVQHWERPGVGHYWPRQLKHLIQRCWKHHPQERPEMSDVVESLAEIQESYRYHPQQRTEELRKESHPNRTRQPGKDNTNKTAPTAENLVPVF